jgi:hypothetical protein
MLRIVRKQHTVIQITPPTNAEVSTEQGLSRKSIPSERDEYVQMIQHDSRLETLFRRRSIFTLQISVSLLCIEGPKVICC